MRNKFKLKVSNWDENIFRNIIKEFETLEEAMLEINLHKGMVKIYDEIEQLIFIKMVEVEFYA